MTTKAKSPKPHRLEALRPLLDSMPKRQGEVFVEHGKKEPLATAICLSCGATDDRTGERRLVRLRQG